MLDRIKMELAFQYRFPDLRLTDASEILVLSLISLSAMAKRLFEELRLKIGFCQCYAIYSEFF